MNGTNTNVSLFIRRGLFVVLTAAIEVAFGLLNPLAERTWSLCSTCWSLATSLIRSIIPWENLHHNRTKAKKGSNTVVVVGASFAGLTCAKELHRKGFRVIVVDFKEYFEYTPGVLRAVVDSSGFSRIACRLQDFFQTWENAHFVQGRVSKVHTTKNFVQVEPAAAGGGGETQIIHFDFVVIAIGTQYSMNWLKAERMDLEASLEGRAQVLETVRRKIEKANSVLVVGGGLTGVELVTSSPLFVKTRHTL
jgi:NADH dehydrogenase FAD-containing subunit